MCASQRLYIYMRWTVCRGIADCLIHEVQAGWRRIDHRLSFSRFPTVRDFISGDYTLFVHPLSQLPGGAAVNPQLIAMSADCSST